MNENSFLDQPKMGKIKGMFLGLGVVILVLELILALIYSVSLGEESYKIIWQVVITLVLTILFILLGLNSLTRIEKGSRLIRVMAVSQLLSGLITWICFLLVNWGIIRFCFFGFHYMCDDMMMELIPTMFIRIIMSIWWFSVWSLNILAIKSINKGVKIMKLITMCLLIYFSGYWIVATLLRDKLEVAFIISMLTLVFFPISIILTIISSKISR